MTHGTAHQSIDPVRSATQPLTHHGRTLAAWTGSVIALVGFVIAAVAFVLPGGINWTVMWIGLAIVARSAIVGLVLRNIGHGAKEN